MRNLALGIVLVVAGRTGQASANFTEVIAAADLPGAERAAFTDAGRSFVIGMPADPALLGNGVLSEIVRGERGYQLRAYVQGTLEGSADGKVSGKPVGDVCVFSGMTRLYYAAGPNVNRIEIAADGSAGSFRSYYLGPALSYIDDFAVEHGVLRLAQLMLSQSIARVDPVGSGRLAVAAGSEPLDLSTAPSSVTVIPSGNALFPDGGQLVTSYFGGGVYLLQGL